MLSDATTSRLLQATVLIGFLLLVLLLVSTVLARPGAAPQGQEGYVPDLTATAAAAAATAAAAAAATEVAGYVPATAVATTIPTSTATPTSTPTPTITPTPSPTATPIVVAPPSKVEVEVTIDVAASRAVDATGNLLVVTEGAVVAEKETTVVAGLAVQQIKITLPIALAAGAEVQSFKDETSGVEIAVVVTENPETMEIETEVQLTIPVKDDEGQTQAKIVAVLAEAPKGTGTTAEAVVTELRLETDAKAVDLTEADPDVGEVEVEVKAILADIPEAASIEINVKKSVDRATERGFELAAAKAKTQLKAIAYAVEIKKEGLEDEAVIASSDVRMCVSQVWVDKQVTGTAVAAILRLSDAGTREILDTRRDSGRSTVTRACFIASSPTGLSVFALAALAVAAEPTPTPVAAGPGQVRQPLSPFVARGLSSPDGRVTINAPALAVETALDLQYTERTMAEVPSSAEFVLVGPQLLLEVLADGTAVEPFRFRRSITLALSYTDSDLLIALNRETELKVVAYSAELGRWVSLGGTLDPLARTVTAFNRGVGLFSLAVLQPAPTPTPVTPVVGDLAPSSAMLLALAFLGFLLMASGAYYLRSPRRVELG